MRKNKIRNDGRLFDIVLIIAMVGVSIIMIYPFIHVIAVSLSSNTAIVSGRITWLPEGWNVKGYEIVFGQATIWRSYLNTMLFVVIGTAVNLICTSMIAYALSVPNFVLRKFFTILLLITMFFSGGVVADYLIVKATGLLNFPWLSTTIPVAISAYNVFVYRAFYKGISNELREAARIDGAGEYMILFRIYAPLSKPLFATFGLFSAVNIWNAYFLPMVYIKDNAWKPISLLLRDIMFTKNGLGGGTFEGIADLKRFGEINEKNVIYACVIATVLPILLIYPFIQKYFTQGMQLGAVKG